MTTLEELMKQTKLATAANSAMCALIYFAERDDLTDAERAAIHVARAAINAACEPIYTRARRDLKKVGDQ